MQHLRVGSRPRFPEPEDPPRSGPPELAGCLPEWVAFRGCRHPRLPGEAVPAAPASPSPPVSTIVVVFALVTEVPALQRLL